MKKCIVCFLLIALFVPTISFSQSWMDKLKQKTQEVKETVKKTWEETKSTRQDVVDAAKNLEYERISDIKDILKKNISSVTISSIKNIPVQDPRSGNTTTFNQYCRNYLQESSLGDSDIANDPVETAVSLMMDENRLFEANLIREQNGSWTSIREASSNGTHGEVVAEFWKMKDDYNSQNYIGFANKFVSMMNKIKMSNR